MRSLGPERYVAVGHHTGAAIGLALASRHQGGLTGLVACGMPLLEREVLERFAVEPPPVHDEAASELLDAWRAHWGYAADGPGRSLIVARSVAEMLAWEDRRPHAHRALARADLESMVREAQVPILVLAGAREMLREASELAASITPLARFEELGRSGFYAPEEDPEALARAIARFAAGAGAPTAS